MIWASPRFGHPQWGMPKTLIASTLPNLACSKRSDGGERCEVKKAMKSRGGLGREVREHLSPSLAFIFSHSFLLRTAPHYLNAWNRLCLNYLRLGKVGIVNFEFTAEYIVDAC